MNRTKALMPPYRRVVVGAALACLAAAGCGGPQHQAGAALPVAGASSSASATVQPPSSGPATGRASTPPPATSGPSSSQPGQSRTGAMTTGQVLANFRALRVTHCYPNFSNDGSRPMGPAPVEVGAVRRSGQEWVITDNAGGKVVLDMRRQLVSPLTSSVPELPDWYTYNCDPAVFTGGVS